MAYPVNIFKCEIFGPFFWLGRQNTIKYLKIKQLNPILFWPFAVSPGKTDVGASRPGQVPSLKTPEAKHAKPGISGQSESKG